MPGAEVRRPRLCGPLVSQSTPPSSPWFATACTTAATAKGPMIPGNDPDTGWPTCPCAAMKARPARYADRASMPVLNTRWTSEGPRRSPNRVQAPTSAAPTGPTRTTAARVAIGLGDHASSLGRSSVAVDSKTTRSTPSTATSRHQVTPPNGPRMSSTAAAATIAPMYSRAGHDSLATPPPGGERGTRARLQDSYPHVILEKAAG